MAVRTIQASYTMSDSDLRYSRLRFDECVSYIIKSLRNALLMQAGYPVDYTITCGKKFITEKDEDGNPIKLLEITAELRYVK